MSRPAHPSKPKGRAAIESDMARQREDALASFAEARELSIRVAAAIEETGHLLLLGMGASHAAGRIVAPLYRRLGIDAVAVTLSEQLAAPLPTADSTLILASQSGESAEVIRWLKQHRERRNVFGLTLDPKSTLAKAAPSLIGLGGEELGFAATRSLTISLALHLAVLDALGDDSRPALSALGSREEPLFDAALEELTGVNTIITSGRLLQGLAEALALGLAELARIPAFSHDGGQLLHGPLEMLGPEIGVLFVRAKEGGAALVASGAAIAAAAGSPAVLLDASGEPPPENVVTIGWPSQEGLAAVFSILPTAQRFMLAFAASRVPDVGTPRRSSKVMRRE
jgi:fructoselysine-6-P-deglycase FrlB-like protein